MSMQSNRAKKVGKRLSEESNMSVSVMPVDDFTERNLYNFKVVLDEMVKKPSEAVKIKCESEEMAKRLQRGFHCSGTGRRMKRAGWRIQTTCIKNVLQVKVTKPSAASAA